MKIPYWQFLLSPWIAYGLGFLSNVVVMAANHSQMPVNMPPGVLVDPNDIFHAAMTSATHLKFLADWIVLGSGIASPGDFGLWLWDATWLPALAIWVSLVIKDHKSSL